MNLKKALPYIAGAAPGVALGALGLMQVHSSAKKSLKAFQNDLVDTKETMKKYAPNISIATNMDEADALNIKPWKDITPKQRDVLQSYLKRIFESGNAAQLEGHNAIIARPMINRSLIGHEIGHQIDEPKSKSIFDKLLVSRIEQRAWNASPFQDDESKKMSNIALGTYRGAEKVMGGAALIPLGVLIAKKMMKK